MGFSGIMVNRGRSALSMLGIILGVFAVVVLMSLGNGVKNEITDELKGLGPNLIQVKPGNPDVQGSGPLATSSQSTLTPEDVKKVAGLPNVATASGSVLVPNASVGGKPLPLTGVDPSYPSIQSVDLASGRFVEQGGEIVLDEPVAKDLLGVDPKSAVGKTLKIQDKSFKVVGVVGADAKDKESGFGLAMPQTSFVTTDDALALSGSKYVDQILAEAKDADSAESAAQEIRTALKSAHGTEDFGARSQKDLLSRFTRITDMLDILLYFIASITLLILGIGIMNMMLASVTDRTKEIGVRKALGATNADVLLQFLFEALFLTAIGGAVGIVLGVLVSKLLPEITTNAPTSTTPTLMGLTFGVSVFSGLVFGVLPAYRAARLEPAEALRRE